MTDAGRERQPRPLVLVMLVALVGSALLAVPAPTVAAAGTSGDPVTVTLTTLPTSLARAGGGLRVGGRLVNTGTEDLRNVEVRLRLSDTRLNSRSELAAVAEGRTSSRDGEVVASRSVPDLGAGQAQAFDLSRPLGELESLTEFGVYVLGVEVLAGRRSGFGRVAILRTLLPWVPGPDDFVPTGFTWLWPLVARPTRLADGSFTDDALAADLAAGGRLARLLEAGVRLQEGAGLTWAIDPELVETVADMADGYEVLGPAGPVPGTGAPLAGAWLEGLAAATSGRPVLALPFGDPDLTALTRAGLGPDVARSIERGRQVLGARLSSAQLQADAAWPIDGFANRATLGLLRSVGVSRVLLDGRALPSVIDLSYTPSGRAHVATPAGRLVGLLAEPGLGDLLRSGGADSLMGAQRFLAETAMITSELPGTGTARTIVLAPPRRWDPSTDYLDRLVEGAAQAPWMAPVSLTSLAAAEPPEVDRAALRYPPAARAAELPAPYLKALATMHASIEVFATILTDREQLVPELDRAVLLLESSWWRGRDSRANRLAGEVKYLADLRGEVRVQPGSFTFSSRRGTIPLTVANGLEQEVRVVLRLDPQTIQLQLADQQQLIRIGPRQKIQKEVDAVAVAGRKVVLVDVTLQTRDGAPYGQPVQVRISITDYGTVALYITLAAAAVLFLTAAVRILQRLRVARRSAAYAGPAPAGDGADDLDRAGDEDLR